MFVCVLCIHPSHYKIITRSLQDSYKICTKALQDLYKIITRSCFVMLPLIHVHDHCLFVWLLRAGAAVIITGQSCRILCVMAVLQAALLHYTGQA